MFAWPFILQLWGGFTGFIKRNWKLVLLGILLIGGYIIINNHINNLKKTAFNNGVAATNKQWNDRVAIEAAANKKYTEALQSVLSQFGQNFQQAQDNRNKQADTKIQEIPIIIKNDPSLANCNVPPAVLTVRNSIRHLGPPGLEP